MIENLSIRLGINFLYNFLRILEARAINDFLLQVQRPWDELSHHPDVLREKGRPGGLPRRKHLPRRIYAHTHSVYRIEINDNFPSPIFLTRSGISATSCGGGSSPAFDLSSSFALGVTSYSTTRLFDFRSSSVAFPYRFNYHRIIFFSIENYQLNSILFFRAQLIWRERWKCGRYGLLISKCRFGILFTRIIITEHRFLRVRVWWSVIISFFF